jgi:AcrR family transcriptional regulator
MTEKKITRLPAQERRVRIISSARTALIRGGLRGFGLAVVAKEAGVAIGLIGHYFGGIDGLIKALLHSAVAKRTDIQTDVPETPERAILALCNIVERNFHPDYYSRDNLLVWLPIYELSINNDDMRNAVIQRDEEDVREMRIVLALICEIRGKTADPTEVSKLFFTLLDGLWLRWCYSGRTDYAEEKRAAIRFLEEKIGPFYGVTS